MCLWPCPPAVDRCTAHCSGFPVTPSVAAPHSPWSAARAARAAPKRLNPTHAGHHAACTPQAANILKRLSSTATTGTETLSTMGSLRNALTAGSTDFSASGLVSLGSGQVPGGFDQVAFYQHLVVRPFPDFLLYALNLRTCAGSVCAGPCVA